MRRHRDWSQLVFAVLLWFGATFVYFGNTGKFSDDWWATSRRPDGTGIDWTCLPWTAWPYFWRPLHLAHVWFVNTLFWRHDWVGHLELALVHAAVCVALYRVLVRLGSAPLPAKAAALLFGVNPLLGEAIGWFSASCNAIGSLLMLITLDLGCRFAASASLRTRPLQLGLMAILSFATACFYEPAAAGLAAMPLVVWAISRSLAGVDPRECAKRTLAATAAAGIPCALYVALLMGTAPPSGRGAAATISDAAPLKESFHAFAGSCIDMTVGHRGRGIVLGSVEHGLAAIRAHLFVLAVVVATIVAGLIALVRAARRSSPPASRQQLPAPECSPSGNARRGVLVLVGVVVMLASALPFIAQHNRVLPSRSLYVPLLGAACVLAGAANGLRAAGGMLPERGRRAACFVAAIVIGALAVLGQIGLIGMQSLFQSNARRDERVAEQLAAMAPRIPAGTAFMVLAADDLDTFASSPAFNSVLHTALRESAAATPFLRCATRRNDVHALTGMHGGRMLVLVDQLSPDGVRDVGVGGKEQRVPWSQIVPIWIDARGKVGVAEVLTIVPLHGVPVQVRLPLAERLAGASIGDASRDNGRDLRHFRLTETPSGNSRISLDAR